MTAAAGGFAPFSFTVAGFGCFPNPRRANVLWAGVPEIPKALAGLQRAVDLQLTRLGYEKEYASLFAAPDAGPGQQTHFQRGSGEAGCCACTD